MRIKIRAQRGGFLRPAKTSLQSRCVPVQCEKRNSAQFREVTTGGLVLMIASSSHLRERANSVKRAGASDASLSVASDKLCGHIRLCPQCVCLLSSSLVVIYLRSLDS